MMEMRSGTEDEEPRTFHSQLGAILSMLWQKVGLTSTGFHSQELSLHSSEFVEEETKDLKGSETC